MNFLQEIFAHICGQQHCWELGRQTLPFCQRCTGLYVGSFVAALIIPISRLRPNRIQYWMHAAFLLLMVPYGFHLVPQGPPLRTVSGFLFAFGLVYYLMLNPLTTSQIWRQFTYQWTIVYVLLIIATVTALLVALHFGDRTWAFVVTLLGALGCASLGILVLANLAIFPRILRQLSRISRASMT